MSDNNSGKEPDLRTNIEKEGNLLLWGQRDPRDIKLKRQSNATPADIERDRTDLDCSR